MANFYHKGTAEPAQLQSADQVLAAVEAFLRTCRSPAVLEAGEELMPLLTGEYTLELRSGRVWIDVWHENQSLSRRILRIDRHLTGSLDCAIHRFGATPGKISFLDTALPQTAHKKLAGSRQNFGEQFRRILFRQFPGWQINSLSSSMDLQRSFSPVFPRARLTRGNHQIAAIACPDAVHEHALLTFALLWFDHVKSSSRRKDAQTRLCLFLPEGVGCLTAHRLRWLNRGALNARLFRYNEHGSAGEVDPDDLGNLDTGVRSRFEVQNVSPEFADLLRSLQLMGGIGVCTELSGAISIRFRGLEFARVENGRVLLGVESKREVPIDHLSEVEHFVQQLASVGPQVGSVSERWLETAVRCRLSAIDPALRESPLHGQVLTFASTDRDLIDLLGVLYSGQLAVIELKGTEDIHLPIQALDYWMRVKWHAERGELTQLFPGISLMSVAPRLLLVAPAISFHSANATVLRYFSPEIDVERVGISSDWESELKVVLRLKGSAAPQSHANSYEHARLVSHQEGDSEPQP